jgi:sugar transferase (PEP-CTERM/EpsH1 system associated)
MKRVLHICHVVLSLEPGGLENGVVNVVNGLDRSDFRCSVCCLQRRGEFTARLRPDVEVIEMGLRPGNDPRLPLKLARLFRATRADIVHTRNPEAFFYGIVGARLAGVPIVVHSEHGRAFPERRLRALVQRWLLTRADLIFAVSEQLKLDLSREIGVDARRIEVLENGVDLEKFHPHEHPIGTGLADRSLLIGSVGRLAPVKNYSLLIEACARLPRVPWWRLVLVGEGPQRHALEKLVRKLDLSGRVELLGHCDDVPDRLRDMDVFVLPSSSEGLSNTLLEAMACRVAVLASDVGGNREIIEEGVSGMLFQPGDIGSAADKLWALMSDEDLRQRLALGGEARARGRFSLEGMLSRYAAMYRRVWSHKHGGRVDALACQGPL